MPDQKDAVFGKLAVERGYLTQEQLDEVLEVQRKMRDELGVDESLDRVLVAKHWLTADQAQEVRNAAAVRTGEARLVAGYEVAAKIGQGGMGAVYKARQVETGQYVALKILPPSLADEEMIARFRREAEIVRKLEHDNIVGCVEFGYDKRRKCYFCALELVEGEDLGKRIPRLGRLSEDEAVSITRQIASALQHAFFNGLVHRDVKPENIMVTSDGTAKLLDLGLARPANQEATRLTESGMFVGSPYYASPEQAVGEKEVDTRSDIYSLGATLYHMVTGKLPFEGTTALAILQKHVTEKLPWPAEVNPDLSDGLCMIIAKMMEKAPGDRYQTPNDLHRDLDLLAAGEEPKVQDAALKNSSVKVPAVRPRRRRRLGARARHGKHAEHKRRDAVRERRRPDAEERTGWSALPTGAKIGMSAGAGVLVALGLGLLLGRGRPDRGPPKTKKRRRPESAAKVPLPKPRESEKGPPTPAPPPEKAKLPVERVKGPVRDGIDKEDPLSEPRREGEEGMKRLAEAEEQRAASRAPPDAVSFGGHWYKLYMEKMTWHQAKRFCEQQGGHLITITSKEENDFVTGLARKAGADAWIGLTDEREEGKWEWVTGERAAFAAWAPEQPDNKQEHWTGIRKEHNFAWNDVPKGRLLPVICEWGTGRHPPTAPLTGIARGLVGWWKFDEKTGTVAHDSSASARHGLVMGDVTWTAGRIGGALLFNGIDTRVVVPRLVKDDFCLAFWMNTTKTGPELTAPHAHYRGKWHQGLALVFGDVVGDADDFGTSLLGADFSFGTGPTDVTLRSTRAVNDGIWHHVAAVRQRASGQMRIYVDGELEASGVGTTNALDAPRQLDIGDWGAYARPFAGIIDDVRIYDRALSATEIRSLVGPLPPSITSTAPRTAFPGFGYRYTIGATGNPTPTLKVTGLPDWLESDGRDTISGTPRVSHLGATGRISIAVTNKLGSDRQDFRIEVRSIDLTRGLVGWWKFDEGEGTVARDSSGKGNDGKLVGKAKWTRGRLGGALRFEGGDKGVIVPDAEVLDLSRAATIATWIMPSTVHTGSVLRKGPYQRGVYYLVLKKGFIRFAVNDTGWAAGGYRLPTPDRWYHVAGVYDGRNRRLYVDGILRSEVAQPGRIAANNWPVAFGSDGDGAHQDELYHGLMDDIRIYDRALSAEEVRALAASK